MKVEATKQRLGLIMTQEDLERLTFLDFGEKGEEMGLKTEVLADVHGMTKKDATRFLRNLVRVTRDTFWLVVIHGYNNGHAIRDSIRKEGFDPRAGMPYEVIDNAGRTFFDIEAA